MSSRSNLEDIHPCSGNRLTCGSKNDASRVLVQELRRPMAVMTDSEGCSRESCSENGWLALQEREVGSTAG